MGNRDWGRLQVATAYSLFLRAHDVAAACRLAMAEVRVRLPLGALKKLDCGVAER